MSISQVGGNTAANDGTSTGYTIPSTLSNAATIASGDIGILQINTANSTNALAVAGWTQIGAGNFDGSGGTFYRVMTGTESGGWAFTCGDGFATSYNFFIWRGASSTISPAPTSTNNFGGPSDTGSSTVAAGCLAILGLTSFSLTGTTATAPTPSPSTTLIQTCADDTLRQFTSFIYATSPTSAGALDYTASWDQNSNWEAVLLVLTPGGSPPLPSPYSTRMGNNVRLGEGSRLCA